MRQTIFGRLSSKTKAAVLRMANRYLDNAMIAVLGSDFKFSFRHRENFHGQLCRASNVDEILDFIGEESWFVAKNEQLKKEAIEEENRQKEAIEAAKRENERLKKEAIEEERLLAIEAAKLKEEQTNAFTRLTKLACDYSNDKIPVRMLQTLAVILRIENVQEYALWNVISTKVWISILEDLKMFNTVLKKYE